MQTARNRIHLHCKVVVYQNAKVQTKKASSYARKTFYEKKGFTENRVKKPKVTIPPRAPGKWTCVGCKAPFEREHYSKWLATRSSQRSDGKQRCNLCYAGGILKRKEVAGRS